MASYFPMIKNTNQRIVFPIFDADGDPVTGAAADTPDSEYSLDGATFVDCSDEIHEIATASGVYYLDILAAECNADCATFQIKTATAGTKTTVLVFYTSAQSLDTTDTAVDAIKTVVDAIPTTAMRGTDNAALASAWTAALATALGNYTAARAGYLDELAAANIPTDLAKLLQVLTGKWEITGNQLIMYDSDGTTPLYTYNLTRDGEATMFNPHKREAV